MIKEFFNHGYIFLSIFFQVASQLTMKWRMSSQSLDENLSIQEKIAFAFGMLFDPFILLSVLLTLFSGLSWIIAMTKFEVSYAFPFTSLGFVAVLVLSYFFLGEQLSLNKVLGVSMIVLGVLVVSRAAA